MKKHTDQIKRGGIKTILKKLISLFFIFFQLALYPVTFIIFIIIILIKPWYLIRWNTLHSSRIGHFALNTELYCCERDANINFPKQKYKDFFYLSKVISNKTLENMWRRNIIILPRWFLKPIHMTSNFFYSLIGTKNIHEINSPACTDRDIYNLLEKFNPHISFTEEEENKGEKTLEKFGLPINAKFVCLIVRDAGYLSRHDKDAGYLSRHDKTKKEGRWSYHNYRDADIEKFVMAAEELASRGYYVFRMGINVLKPLKSSNPRIIDYANSKIRSDFMDMYLGAKCSFCISTACGFDAIPMTFRRPVAFITVPICAFATSMEKSLLLTRPHINKLTKKELSISEIFSSNAARTFIDENFKKNNIELKENTSEEIRDLAIEMDERVNRNWKEEDEDIKLQQVFWSIFEKNINNLYHEGGTHGKIKAKFSAKYLRDNKDWVK